MLSLSLSHVKVVLSGKALNNNESMIDFLSHFMCAERPK